MRIMGAVVSENTSFEWILNELNARVNLNFARIDALTDGKVDPFISSCLRQA